MHDDPATRRSSWSTPAAPSTGGGFVCAAGACVPGGGRFSYTSRTCFGLCAPPPAHEPSAAAAGADQVVQVPPGSGFCRTAQDAGNVSWIHCPAHFGNSSGTLTIGANHVSNSCRGPGVSPQRASPSAPYLDNPAVCMTWDASLNARCVII